MKERLKMGCELLEPMSVKELKQFKNFFFDYKTGKMYFDNPMLKVSKNGSRKHKRCKTNTNQ